MEKGKYCCLFLLNKKKCEIYSKSAYDFYKIFLDKEI